MQNSNHTFFLKRVRPRSYAEPVCRKRHTQRAQRTRSQPAGVQLTRGSRRLEGPLPIQQQRGRLCVSVPSCLCVEDGVGETHQGAGGVGGLVAVSIAGQYYFPCYDNRGNVVPEKEGGYWQ